MAAPFKNYSGGVLLADIIKTNNFAQYVSQAIKEQSKFLSSGVVQRNSLLDSTSGGTRIQVPQFNPIAPTEEILDGTATWGTSGAGYLTPQKISTGTQVATITHRGFSYAVDDIAVLAAGDDPMIHIRNQLATAINKLTNAKLFSQLAGLFGTALAGNALDVALGAAGPNAAEANFLSASTIAKARNLLGTRGEELNVLVVHPSVYYYLLQVGMLTFSTSALSTGGAVTWGGGGVGVTDSTVGSFAGCTVVVDEAVNTVAPGTSGHQTEFFCYLTSQGAIQEGIQKDQLIEAERNILSKQTVMSLDYHNAYHVMGTKWNDAADNPSNTLLATANKWAATYDVDLIPLVQITVNSPMNTTNIS